MRDKKRNLRVYERANLYPQSISYYLPLLRLPPREYKYVVNFWEVMAYKDNYFWWARDSYYLEKFFRKLFKQWLINKKFRQEFFSWYKRDVIAMRRQVD